MYIGLWNDDDGAARTQSSSSSSQSYNVIMTAAAAASARSHDRPTEGANEPTTRPCVRTAVREDRYCRPRCPARIELARRPQGLRVLYNRRLGVCRWPPDRRQAPRRDAACSLLPSPSHHKTPPQHRAQNKLRATAHENYYIKYIITPSCVQRCCGGGMRAQRNSSY